jgi:hypothetical protein
MNGIWRKQRNHYLNHTRWTVWRAGARTPLAPAAFSLRVEVRWEGKQLSSHTAAMTTCPWRFSMPRSWLGAHPRGQIACTWPLSPPQRFRAWRVRGVCPGVVHVGEVGARLPATRRRKRYVQGHRRCWGRCARGEMEARLIKENEIHQIQ